MADDGKKPVTLTIGWVMLVIMGLLMAIGGAESLVIAYRGNGPLIAGMNARDLSPINPDLPAALRGRRATAATLALTCGLLISWIAAVPFRRGERWSWFALLSAVGLGAVLSMLRVPMLETRAGAGAAAIFLVWLILALAVSYRDMTR
jgi:hypothetical protein